MDKLIYPGQRLKVLALEAFASVWETFFRKLTARADAAYLVSDLTSSYPVDITITGVAASGLAAINSHTRRYPSGDVTVSSGSVSAIYGTTVYLYYDDPTRSGGLVAYVAATTLTDAFLSPTNPSRHYVGKVTMPATAGASDTSGTPSRPLGYT